LLHAEDPLSITQARSHVPFESKKHHQAGGESSSQALQDANRVLAEEKLKQHIVRTVACAPPLTPEQRDRLSVLLRGGAQ